LKEKMAMATVPVRRGDPEAEEAGHLHVRRRLPLLRAGGRRKFLAGAASGHRLHAGLDDPDHLLLLAILGNLGIAIHTHAQFISEQKSLIAMP
jgi:hypothetical protein